MNTTTHSVTVMGKKHAYKLSTKGKVTHVTCDAAKIDQEFLNEDIPALLSDLPNLILSEKKYQKKQDAVIRLRVSGKEKLAIQRKAQKQGFSSVSAYIRERALA